MRCRVCVCVCVCVCTCVYVYVLKSVYVYVYVCVFDTELCVPCALGKDDECVQSVPVRGVRLRPHNDVAGTTAHRDASVERSSAHKHLFVLILSPQLQLPGPWARGPGPVAAHLLGAVLQQAVGEAPRGLARVQCHQTAGGKGGGMRRGTRTKALTAWVKPCVVGQAPAPVTPAVPNKPLHAAVGRRASNL